MPDKDKEQEVDVVPAGSQEIGNNEPKQQAQNQDKEGTKEAPKGSEDTKSADQDNDKSGNAETKSADKEPSSDIESVLKKYAETQEQITGQLSSLNQQMQSQQQSQQQQVEQGPDYQSQLTQLDQKLSDGEITLAEHTQQSRNIMQQQLTEQITSQFEEKMSERQAEEARQRFLQENPDFEQVSQSPEFQQFLEQNPVYDVAGAYEHFKRQEQQQQMQTLQEQLDQLKQEREAAVKNGAKVTDTVGKSEGHEMRQGNQNQNDNLGVEGGMLAALRQFRSQAGTA